MDVLCSTDNQFIMPTGVMLTSLFENNSDEEINVHILHDGLTNDSIAKIKTIVCHYGKTISFYCVDKSVFHDFPIGNDYQAKHITSLATYYRLFITDFLPNSINKLIYLDGDMIIRGSLKSLWEMDISNYFLAGVPDVFCDSVSHYNRLLYPRELGYFNAGMLVINVKVWRELRLRDQFISFINNHQAKLAAHDQDVLNYVCRSNKLFVGCEYNMQTEYFYKDEYSPFLWNRFDEIHNAQINPIVIHYTGADKPWKKKCVHPYKDEFIKYYQMTEWHDIPFEDEPFKERLKARIRKSLSFLGVKINCRQDKREKYIGIS